jgi:hypothetical protein
MGPELAQLLARQRANTPAEPPFVYDEDAWVIPIARRLDLSFDGRASGSQQRVVLAAGIDVTEWVSGNMLFILHARNAWLTAGGGNTTAQGRFEADSIALDPDDPSVDFIDTSRTVAQSPIILASTTAPLCAVDAFEAPFGPQLRVFAWFTQGAAAAASAQTLTVSIYLSGRRW